MGRTQTTTQNKSLNPAELDLLVYSPEQRKAFDDLGNLLEPQSTGDSGKSEGRYKQIINPQANNSQQTSPNTQDDANKQPTRRLGNFTGSQSNPLPFSKTHRPKALAQGEVFTPSPSVFDALTLQFSSPNTDSKQVQAKDKDEKQKAPTKGRTPTQSARSMPLSQALKNLIFVPTTVQKLDSNKPDKNQQDQI